MNHAGLNMRGRGRHTPAALNNGADHEMADNEI
jgi:hypothetical protein